ncbi:MULTISPECIES: YggT family protein [Bacillales]|uniref:YggT family protein n=1 Tax=Paenibacillus agri TaxID=2744309 RepID=A0A850EPM7_9BACL|nr:MULTISPECIES: YggT family protein [Bacillales]NUU62426.1 YggT family protein [Paenibacillus agri]
MYQEVSSIIDILFNIYFYMIFIYILMSWVPSVRENFIGELLAKLVEPYLSPFRKIIPPLFGMLDISPIVALFVLRWAVYGLKSLLSYVL